MSKVACFLLIAIALSLGACGAVTPARTTPVPATPVPQATVTVAPKTGTLRVASPSTAALDDMPFWIAQDTLRQQGYTIETTQYARFDLVTAGLAGGEVDLAASSNETAWAAIAKGAPIRAVVGRLNMMYVLAAKAEIKACADLESKSIATGSTTSVLAGLLNAYLKQDCPAVQPQIAVISSSSNRLAALLSGTVDAATLDEGDALELERQAPGEFHILVYFASEFPQIDSRAFYVRSDFAAQHPEIVKDFVMAIVQAVRSVQDPQALREAIERYLPGDAAALANADTYLAHKAWDVNGGLTLERIEHTLDFLTNAGAVPSGLEKEQLVDLSYLNAVLDEVGRK